MLLRKASRIEVLDIIDLASDGRWCVENVGLSDDKLTIVLSNRGTEGPAILKRLRCHRDDYLVFVTVLEDFQKS